VSARWRPRCSNAQRAEDTPGRRLRAAGSESCRGSLPASMPEHQTGRLANCSAQPQLP
jgi:hypothetical protein